MSSGPSWKPAKKRTTNGYSFNWKDAPRRSKDQKKETVQRTQTPKLECSGSCSSYFPSGTQQPVNRVPSVSEIYRAVDFSPFMDSSSGSGACTKEVSPRRTSGKELAICGIKVPFPHQPYPSQTMVMEKVIRCLTNSQHGLLESPTGSGKSLALLCSSLAWMKAETKKGQSQTRLQPPGRFDSFAYNLSKDSQASKESQSTKSEIITIDDDDCQIISDTRSTSSSLPSSSKMQTGKAINKKTVNGKTTNERSTSTKFSWKARPKAVIYEDEDPPAKPMKAPDPELEYDASDWIDWDMDKLNAALDAPAPEEIQRYRIYYCTRTHKQIAQLIRELKKTAFRDVRMSILGSREQYCIHEVVSTRVNKNELCAQLLDSKNAPDSEGLGKDCRYFGPSKQLKEWKIREKYGLGQIFDIEELVTAGKTRKFCPYFGSRELASDAQLIFCPYNYLVDSKIRRTMQIEIENQIIIFDEGHNMEDAAREAASFSLKHDQLNTALLDILDIAGGIVASPGGEDSPNPLRSDLLAIHGMLFALRNWIDQSATNIVHTGLDGGTKGYEGMDMLQVLNSIGWGRERFDYYAKLVETVYADKHPPERSEPGHDHGENEDHRKIAAVTLMVIDNIRIVIDNLYRDNCKYAADYICVLAKELTINNTFKPNPNSSRRKRNTQETHEWSYTLNFWCLNPAVAFSDFKSCRSVLLTSGTLSPMATFQSELGLDFNIKFEAQHVVGMDQVWAGAVGKGPGNAMTAPSLLGVYQVTQTLAYQDGIGDAIWRVCEIVPKGVLCFFSSYAVLNTVVTRMKDKGTWEKIEGKKKIFMEPRNLGNKQEFERMMKSYYSAVKGEKLADGQNGPLMFGVFRGKISEGLDFADDNARAVITVGIPYPALKDPLVEYKKNYNDKRVHLGLLAGKDWYEIQAFRAINQALGRCLRHKNDWGALILLDQRFSTATPDSRQIQGLSKWLRPQIKQFMNFDQAMISLDQFIKHRLSVDTPKAMDNYSCDAEFDWLMSTEEDSVKPSPNKKPTW